MHGTNDTVPVTDAWLSRTEVDCFGERDYLFNRPDSQLALREIVSSLYRVAIHGEQRLEFEKGLVRSILHPQHLAFDAICVPLRGDAANCACNVVCS